MAARPSRRTRLTPRRPSVQPQVVPAASGLVQVSDQVSPRSKAPSCVPLPSCRLICCESSWKRLWSIHKPYLDIPDLRPTKWTRRDRAPCAFTGRETREELDRQGTKKRGTKRRPDLRTETAGSEARDLPEPMREHVQSVGERGRFRSPNRWDVDLVLDKVSQVYKDSTGTARGETGFHSLLGHSASPASQPLDLSCKKCRKSTNQSETSTPGRAPLPCPAALDTFACCTTQQWVELAIHKARNLRQASLGPETKQQCTESSDWPPKAPQIWPRDKPAQLMLLEQRSTP
uniref:uncharacterized protein isoform X2 n=1 Tax=Myxine glutinosa TaxID=7769 RepID=UPI00358F33E5